MTDLESKLLTLPSEVIPLLKNKQKKFRELREDLSKDPNSVELKNSGAGIISWTARGQLGIESKIKATTGFQTQGENKSIDDSYCSNIKKTKK